MLKYQDRLCVPIGERLQERIMHEAHISSYSILPGSKKIYCDLGEVYWREDLREDMKKGIAEFVAKCPNCQQVKLEHERLGGLA